MMIKDPLWKHVPLQWGIIPEEWLSGKKLKQLIEAYRHRSVEIMVSFDEKLHWRRWIDNETLELGL